MRKSFLTFVALAALAISPQQSAASLIGDTVTGVLNFDGFGATNFFDPANGGVPGGAPNAAGPNVLVTDPGLEFQYLDGFAGIDVNVGANQVSVLQFLAGSPGGANGWDIFLTDLDWLPASSITGINIVGSTFPGLTADFGADFLHIRFPGADLLSDNFSAGIEFETSENGVSPVPEPATVLLIGGGLLFVAAAARRRLLS